MPIKTFIRSKYGKETKENSEIKASIEQIEKEIIQIILALNNDNVADVQASVFLKKALKDVKRAKIYLKNN